MMYMGSSVPQYLEQMRQMQQEQEVRRQRRLRRSVYLRWSRWRRIRRIRRGDLAALGAVLYGVKPKKHVWFWGCPVTREGQ